MKKKKKIIVWSVLGALVVGLVVVKYVTDKGSEVNIEFKNTIDLQGTTSLYKNVVLKSLCENFQPFCFLK